jgi:hypothetical protein
LNAAAALPARRGNVVIFAYACPCGIRAAFLVRSGSARYIGVSNFLAYRLAKALGRQDTLKLTRFVSAQPRYNLLFREVERELFPLVQEEGLAVIPFNPLARGLLSGKYKHGDTPEKGRFSAELGGFGQAFMPGIGTSASLKQLPGFRKSPNSMERQSRPCQSLGCWRILPLLRSFLAQATSSS